MTVQEKSIYVETNEKVDSKETYEKVYSDGTDKKIEAFKMALDTRKFEIELYWKRAGYFWAFIAVSFAAYFMAFNNSNLENKDPNYYNEILLGISLFGLFVSCCWYLVNKGSKYWQENWEKHLDLLEDDFMGPLYKMTVKDKRSWGYIFHPFCSYKYSVGKINLFLSFLVVLVWCVIAFNRIALIYGWTEPFGKMFNEVMIVIAFEIAILALFWYCRSTGSNGADHFVMEHRTLKTTNSFPEKKMSDCVKRRLWLKLIVLVGLAVVDFIVYIIMERMKN